MTYQEMLQAFKEGKTVRRKIWKQEGVMFGGVEDEDLKFRRRHPEHQSLFIESYLTYESGKNQWGKVSGKFATEYLTGLEAVLADDWEICVRESTSTAMKS